MGLGEFRQGTATDLKKKKKKKQLKKKKGGGGGYVPI
jgi:hypothetical protein